jgi:hypothetical protein
MRTQTRDRDAGDPSWRAITLPSGKYTARAISAQMSGLALRTSTGSTILALPEIIRRLDARFCWPDRMRRDCGQSLHYVSSQRGRENVIMADEGTLRHCDCR